MCEVKELAKDAIELGVIERYLGLVELAKLSSIEVDVFGGKIRLTFHTTNHGGEFSCYSISAATEFVIEFSGK